VKGLVRRLLHELARTSAGRRVLMVLLKDEQTLRFVYQDLSNRLSAEASFERDRPSDPRLGGFEDCVWVFSSNQLNHGLSRLSISEGAYLYRLARSLRGGRIAELGRFRGGSTFLLATTGAQVLSLDLDSPPQRANDTSLSAALAFFGLRDRVRLELADSRSYPVEEESCDLVFVDADHHYEAVRADVDTWLPALNDGGHLVLHDAAPGTLGCEGVARLADELRAREDVVEVPHAPDTLAHFTAVRLDGGNTLVTELARRAGGDPRPSVRNRLGWAAHGAERRRADPVRGRT
jgi:predicted O-methyltransferase YrrM